MKRLLNEWDFMRMAPDGAEGEGSGAPQGEVELDEPVDDEVDYVVEGSEAARGISTEGLKSQSEIMEELAAARAELTALQAGSAPVNALQQSMEKLMTTMQPAKAPRRDGASQLAGFQGQRMNDADFEKHINQLMLENPYQAQQEAQMRMMEPLLQTVAINQSHVSRELLFSNAENKKLYDKYADEIEDAVAAIPMIDRVKNPKVYQTVLASVKSAHSDELVQESTAAQVASLVAAELAKYGIDPSKPPVAKTPIAHNAPQSITNRPVASASGTRRTVAIPAWVHEEARIKGMDAGFLYERYRSQGKVR